MAPRTLKSRKKSMVKRVMKDFKEKKLHSGSPTGPKVKSRKQAIAVALSEADSLKKNTGKKSRK